MSDLALTKYLAELGKLALNDLELESLTADIAGILDLMDQVKKFDPAQKTTGAPPCLYEDLRRDETAPSSSPDEITANAKSVKAHCFTVPKVV